MRKKNIFITFVVFLLILLTLSVTVLELLSRNGDKVEEVESLISMQYEKEKKFKTAGYTIDNPNIIVNPYGNSPLTALVLFETDSNVSPKVTIKGKDKLSTYTNTFENGKKHYLSIYGLYPDNENEILIEFNDTKKILKIKTDKLPDNLYLPTSVKAKKEKLDNKLYFYTPSSVGYTCAYDVNGDVRWYLSNYALWNITKLRNGRILLSTERLVNSPYYMTGLYEMDFLGKIYNEYSVEGGYHHDYFEMENGNILLASDDFDGDNGTVEDYIVEIDRQTGKIVKQFDLKDVLNMEDGKSENWIEYDWFHNNSVWYDKETNSITLSGRHQDAVINIDYKSGKLNWIIGDSTNWSEEYQKYFFKPIGKNFEWQWSQHAAMITPEGYVFLFDNGNNKSKLKDEYVKASNSYSRGVMYKINTIDMTIEQVFEYGKKRGSNFYSPYISDVDYLANNHYIIHSGGISYKDGKVLNVPAGLGGADTLKTDTVEILDDEIIFELVLPTNNYRVEKLGFYDNYTFELGKGKRKGSLGKTEIDSQAFGFVLDSEKQDNQYASHNISFKKEVDRLVVKGQFKRGTDVNVILYKNGKTMKYNIPISKKPYTALCVDVFTEEENENGIVVTKYINSSGLKGSYSIYLEIDGKVYNTSKYVKF
ncbi:MAG: aryl-sulfate sulfotransferase [Bacilli bacterium]|nr:aryl-sulfate sulfotransferase [Bacilli bacterium]